jgi:hypothetical protein
MKATVARALVGGALIFGMLGTGSAPAANDVTVCRVTGTVSLVNRDTGAPLPLNDVPRKGAYIFHDTNIICTGTINATYEVDASGTSTGIADPAAGEDCNQGQNDAPLLPDYPNTFTAKISPGSGSGPAQLNGAVLFKRFGGLVLVTGDINDPATTAAVDYRYQGIFQFTPGTRFMDLPQPNPSQIIGCFPEISGGVTTAALDGIAIVRLPVGPF